MHRGSRRSFGCGACRRIKMKVNDECDENRPICDRCLRAGRECVYPPQFHFVDTNTRFAAPEARERPTPPRTGTEELKAKLTLLHGEGDDDGMIYKFQLLRYRSTTPPSSSGESSPSVPKAPSLSRGEKLASALAASFKAPPYGYRLHHLGRYMSEIPSRLGHNPALDIAVECLLQSHAQLLEAIQFSQPSTQPSPEYMRALQTLQNVIADPVLGTSAETVCATMLMAHYEMMAPERRSHQYIAHAGGASKLIFVRGPRRVRTSFEYSLFRTQRGRIVLEALLRGEHCFLLTGGWQDICPEKCRSIRFSSVDYLFESICRIPTLVKYVVDWKAGVSELGLHDITDIGRRLQQELRAASPRGSMSASLEGDLGFEEHRSSTLDDEFPLSIHFHSHEGAIFHTWRWMALLLTELCLVNLVADPRLRLSIADTARRICMCYEYASLSKPLGAQFLQVPLIVAYAVSDQKVKKWILDKINLLIGGLYVTYTGEYLDTMSMMILKGLK
ncbi:hypothetical protein BBK36DRAFT_1120201 [Trichoderma citrinoviride]|uniref:Zn(2)-C6 fungal-type domain-containing protein n=1 Tax=Trichoderma citrinoviride TaxID=58853 RepID=A0A2T4B8S5_9HYPO|nr:hypothetical protein BBK36DRAFT_1120201 [Trichoderma citrinoviride]PTB65735.1 hypothetical protein BBK36DRAFT_1120201 [Trichoderma citrinoviride]